MCVYVLHVTSCLVGVGSGSSVITLPDSCEYQQSLLRPRYSLLWCIISYYVDGIDFDSPSTTNETKFNLVIDPGMDRVRLPIIIIDDSQFEPAETFRLTVEVPSSSATLGVTVGEIASTKVTINNDESKCVVVLSEGVMLYHYRSM